MSKYKPTNPNSTGPYALYPEYRERQKEQKRKEYAENREAIRAKRNARYANDPEYRAKVAAQKKAYLQTPEGKAAKAKQRKRYAATPEFKVQQNLRTQQRKLDPRQKALSAWSQMKRRANNNDGNNPAYANVEIRMTKEQFLAWAIPEFQKRLAENSNETWSVDRILESDDSHYELGNLQIISIAANVRKRKYNVIAHSPDGQSWCSKCKQYLPLDKFGKSANRPNGVANLCKICRKASR